MPNSPTNLNVVQIAYHVADIRVAALDMMQKFGAGPFFFNENIQLATAEYHGEPTEFVHSSAFGQWGDVMVEMTRQENDGGRTPYRDMYKKGEFGLHHTAIFVDSVKGGIEDFANKGFELSTYCVTAQGGVEFAYIDATQTLGHMIEIYEPSPGLTGFYDMVREASIGWDGSDPLRG